MSVRTPEETARLAATVTVETPHGSFRRDGGVWTRVAPQPGQFTAPNDPWLVTDACAADLAEARAEVETACEALGVANAERLALRGHVKLLAEWQAAKRDLRTAVNVHGENSYAWTIATRLVFEIEARLLAADLGEEVGR